MADTLKREPRHEKPSRRPQPKPNQLLQDYVFRFSTNWYKLERRAN